LNRDPYSTAVVTVRSFGEAVRKHPQMYFAADSGSPDLPTSILRAVISDALHAAGGRHRAGCGTGSHPSSRTVT